MSEQLFSENLYGAALFDMDGVIINSRQKVIKFWEELARKHNVLLSPVDFEEIIFGRKAENSLHTLFQSLTKVEIDDALNSLNEFEEELEYMPVEGVVEFLKLLHRFKIRLALVTSANNKKAQLVIKYLKLEDIFSTIVTAESVTHSKPDPEGYLLAAGVLGINPKNCIVFEDAVSGVQAGVGSGCTVVGVGHNTIGLVHAGALCVILSFAEIITQKLDDSALLVSFSKVCQLRFKELH